MPSTPPDDYAEWAAVLRTIGERGGTTIVLGGTDAGKTTFTRLLVSRSIEAGKRVAILDSDPGQSEIGPPACAGLAYIDGPLTEPAYPDPTALAFIGAISPHGRLLETITAVRRLADLAGDRALVVDTCGYIHGAGARRLLECMLEILSPNHIVALQRTTELEGIVAPFRRREGCIVHAPGVPNVITRKTASLRGQRRAMRFSAYLRDAQVATFPFHEVTITGAWFGSGKPVAPHILRFLRSAIGPPTRVYYAEMAGRHLGIMANRAIDTTSPELGVALSQLGASAVSVTDASRLKHLVVGLEASNGKLLGLGLIVSLDFRAGLLGLLTPVQSPHAACILRFGVQRITPDGRDAGALKPDEL